MQTHCLTCNRLFEVWPSVYRRGFAKNCSKKCSNKFRKMYIVSEETKKKISESLMGRMPSNLEHLHTNASYRLRGKMGPSSHHWKGGKPKCIDCGKQITYGKKRCNLHSNKLKSGSNHYNWRGGITPVNIKTRNSIEYKWWREAVFKRDSFTCVICGKRGSKLQADHIKPFSIFPNEGLNIKNGRTLCLSFHKNTDTFAGKISTIRKHLNLISDEKATPQT